MLQKVEDVSTFDQENIKPQHIFLKDFPKR